MPNFTQILEQSDVLVADGAMGTMLQQKGLEPGSAPERWNVERPDAVRAVHQAYVDAGADLILTNTFGGTPIRLARDGLSERARELNSAAARLAQEAAGDAALVLGDVGPTSKLLDPLGTLKYGDAVAAFAEQARGLLDGGVDAFLVETMSDLNELRAAVEGVRSVTELPILSTMSFDTRGRTMMGIKPEQAALVMEELGVKVVGANCGRTLDETLQAVLAMREAVPDLLLMAKPNAGLPHQEGDALVYDVTPEVMAEYALRFVEEGGVCIFGGCCGSTPAHIAAVARALKG